MLSNLHFPIRKAEIQKDRKVKRDDRKRNRKRETERETER